MSDRGKVVVPSLALADLVSRDVPLPPLRRVRRAHGAEPPPIDVRDLVRRELVPALGGVHAGDRVAVGIGSRGIARIAEVAIAVVDLLRERGAEPYVVPAMGSHGGATADGQEAVLAGLGITEASIRAPIRSSMDTTVIAQVDGMDVHVAREALDAAHILVINRLKSHTSFSGRIESGLAKMLAIGLAKQRGAEEMHRLGPLKLEGRILAACSVLATKLPLLGGLALSEDAHKRLATIDFLGSQEVGGSREAELLARARRHEARLPFESIDVLIVDAMGKEISGTGMDTNVLGRRMVRGSPEPSGPRITNVVVLSVTPGSEGNAVGLGLADFIPRAVLDGVDLVATYANALTAGLQGVQRAQVPIVLASDRDAITAAVMTAGVPDPSRAAVVRIRSTLALDELMVSPWLATPQSGLEVVDEGQSALLFDATGTLLPWPRLAHPGTGLPVDS